MTTTALVVAGAIIGASLIGTLVLAAIGVALAAPRAARLKARIDGYSDLPIARALRETQVSLEVTRAKVAEIERLVGRAQAAVQQIRTSVEELAAAGARVGATFARLRREVSGLLRSLGRFARPRRSRGS